MKNKQVKIINNMSDGFDNGTICEIIKKLGENRYLLEGYWESKLMKFDHYSNEFEIIE